MKLLALLALTLTAGFASAQCVTIPLSAPGASPVVTINSCTTPVTPVSPAPVTSPPASPTGLAISLSALPVAAQYGTYSEPLSSHVSGGTPPYGFALVSQSGYNPTTWAIKSGALVNAMPKLLNVETANLVVKVTDAAAHSITGLLTVQTARTVPAGAAALGYNRLIYASRPVLSQIGFGPYGADNKSQWYSGLNYTTQVPPAGLYSMSPSGVLLMHQAGAGTGPNATTPTIMGARPAIAGDLVGPSTLPLIPVGPGYYIDYTVQVVSGASHTIRPAVWQLPSQHSNPGSQSIDPANPSVGQQWLEKDAWEGASSLNGKGSTVGWNGNTPYSIYIAGRGQVNVGTNNPVVPNQDTSLEHAYGYSWSPATATSARWLDNAPGGSWQTHTAAGVAMSGATLAWANKATDYPIVSAYNDGSGPFVMAVYEVAVYGP